MNTNTENRTAILEAILNNKDLCKALKKMSSKDFDINHQIDRFISDSERYILATKEGRMTCTITSVSNSGMSRNLHFNSFEINDPTRGSEDMGYYSNYMMFFKSLGFTEAKQSGSFRIGCCGMDMVFHTNYTIIHKLHRLGFINKQECDKLAQKTPRCL